VPGHWNLELKQKNVIPVTGTIRTVYNSSIISQSNGGIDSIKQVVFSTILPDYLARNETTAYTNQYPVWTAGASTNFELKAYIQVPFKQPVMYQPGVMECLRTAIILYLAVYVFIAALVGAGTHFLFENQVFETRMHDDSKPKTHVH